MMEVMIQEMYVPDSAYDQRQPYQLIYLALLENYRTFCGHKLSILFSKTSPIKKGWLPNEQELDWSYEQVECSFSYPIEELMLEIANLILDGGRSFDNVKWMNYHREKIQKILQKNDLRTMLDELPQPERQYFEYDLRLLKPLGLFGNWE